MKILKTICSMILCMTLITVLSACGGGGTNTTSSSSAKQGVTFTFSKGALVSAKTTTKNTGKTVASVAIDPTAKYVSITVKDTNGTTTNYKTDIYTLNGSYITATVPLTPGNYQLTEFLVLDSNNNILYLVPTQTASDDIKALVSTVLPISIGVTKDQANTVTLQILAPDNNTPSKDYGYPSVSFSIVNYIRFMSFVQTQDNTTTNLQVTDANLTVNGVIYSHPAQTTTLRVSQADSYTLVFSKTGYDTKTITLTAADIASYQTAPLVVTLTPAVYHTVTFNSNGGTAVPSQSIVTGGVAISPANPSKTGYTFAGWYSDAGLTTPFYFSATITADMVLHAKWGSTPSPTTIGQVYQGGFYAGTITDNGTDYYLIVAPKAIGETSARWDSYIFGSDIDGWYDDMDTGLTSLTAGPANSAALAAVYGDRHSAALFCEGLIIGGYSDWYLPAINELRIIKDAGDVLTAIGEGFISTGYWSSTEANAAHGRGWDFSNNSEYTWPKELNRHVRAVRRVAI